jgi:hypothetical protein
MKKRAYAMAIVALIAGAFMAFRPARAQDAGAPGPGYHPVELRVGETFDVCKSGMIVCPARTPICDDPKVVVPVDLTDGLGFKGVSPGTTLCSAASAVGPRRVFRITVR